jgi:hypothetical protein
MRRFGHAIVGGTFNKSFEQHGCKSSTPFVRLLSAQTLSRLGSNGTERPGLPR